MTGPHIAYAADRFELIQKHKLGMNVEFVPLSKSRNAKETAPKSFNDLTLNWKVTLLKDGKPIITTDYSAGIGHCPAYKAKNLGMQNCVMRFDAVLYECEIGLTHCPNYDSLTWKPIKGKQIEPDFESVLYSLIMDSDVFDYANFEDWASNFGYDVDSRKAETIYKQCMGIALAVRNGLGDSLLTKLKEAFTDY